MQQFAHAHALLALLRDGFHEQSSGGKVVLREDGSPVLDYPITDFVWDGVKRALLSIAEIQFAAGTKAVYPVHEMPESYTNWNAARNAAHKALEDLPYQPCVAKVASAHVMGGCTMSDDRRLGVVSTHGRYHGIANLSVHDDLLFPTAIGANPQLSIYGITAKLASALAAELTGHPAPALQRFPAS